MTTEKIVWRTNENGDYILSGSLVRDTVPGLWQQRKAWLPTTSCAVLDLSELDRVDSAGMVMLLHTITELQKADCQVTLRHVPQQLKTLLQLSHIESMFAACME